MNPASHMKSFTMNQQTMYARKVKTNENKSTTEGNRSDPIGNRHPGNVLATRRSYSRIYDYSFVHVFDFRQV